MKKHSILTAFFCAAALTAPSLAHAQGGGEAYGKGVRIELNDDGSRYFRFISWLQVWNRVTEMNPGSRIDGELTSVEADVALRRARMLAYGQITDDVLIMLHFGINNQTFRQAPGSDAFKPQLFFHDAWVEYKVLDKYLSIGTGLHYFHGISRQTNASTLNFLTIDAPITNWPLIDQADQFARQLGIYAKGKIANLDYRIALNRPFETRNGPPALGDNRAVFNNAANSWSTAGYFKWQFMDAESNLLPYTVGSYLGTKSVFNIGAGYYYQPDLTVRNLGERETFDTFLFGADLFYDSPLGSKETGGALTALYTFYYFDFGPNFIRNIGISNIADAPQALPDGVSAGTSFNGRGNAYPTVGTGTMHTLEVGYLLPTDALNGLHLQPYTRVQLGIYDALDLRVAPVIEGGVNWLMIGHHAKLTLHYRARPIFLAGTEDQREFDGFASEGILQAMIYF